MFRNLGDFKDHMVIKSITLSFIVTRTGDVSATELRQDARTMKGNKELPLLCLQEHQLVWSQSLF